LHYIPQIERLIKNAKFIHILRGGTDVIASLYEISQKYDDPWGIELRSLERCIEIWAEDTRLDMQYFGKPNHYLVKYEQMTADSRSVVVDLCRFLNIPFEEQMLTDYSSVVSQLVTKNEPWKATVGTPIEKRQGHKFYSLFTPEQQQYILEHIPKDIDYESLLEH